MKLADLPPRVLLAVAVTVLAVVVLAAQTVLSDGDAGDADPAPTTTELDVPDDAGSAEEDPTVVPPEPVEVQPDWYPKRSSRYSDRSPEASVTTVPVDPGG